MESKQERSDQKKLDITTIKALQVFLAEIIEVSTDENNETACVKKKGFFTKTTAQTSLQTIANTATQANKVIKEHKEQLSHETDPKQQYVIQLKIEKLLIDNYKLVKGNLLAKPLPTSVRGQYQDSIDKVVRRTRFRQQLCAAYKNFMVASKGALPAQKDKKAHFKTLTEQLYSLYASDNDLDITFTNLYGRRRADSQATKYPVLNQEEKDAVKRVENRARTDSIVNRFFQKQHKLVDNFQALFTLKENNDLSAFVPSIAELNILSQMEKSQELVTYELLIQEDENVLELASSP